MTSKHTAGPWRIKEIKDAREKETVEINILTDDVDIAQITAFEDPETILDARADAHLIAAAPEMLEVLDEFIELREDTELSLNDYLLRRDAMIENIIQVRNKARGGVS